jgi:hypothetical protein
MEESKGIKEGRRRAPFIGEGQPPRRAPAMPLPLPHSCGWTLHSPFLKPTQAILISTQEIPRVSSNKTILFSLIFFSSLINKH